VLGLAALALLPSSAAAKPRVCAADVIQQALIDAGKLTLKDVENGEVVDLIRCGDITADGASDALFTVASGRYRWTGSHFKAGKAMKRSTAPRRFYRP
jgi:hypothetical protein